MLGRMIQSGVQGPRTVLAWAKIFSIIVTALAVCEVPAESEHPSSNETLVAITTPQGVTIQAELADSTEKRARGLMFRDSLPQDRGMLFTFPEQQEWSFWMKNTRIPLDILWMDKNRKIVHVEHNVPICTRTDDGCPNYQPNDPALYVLELAAGAAESLKLQRGVKLQFQMPAARQ